MTESIYMTIMIMCHTISMINMLVANEYPKSVIIYNYVAIVFVCLLALKYYRRYRHRKGIIVFKGGYKISVNHKRLDWFVFILSLATLLYSLQTGMGTAEHYTISSGSQIFSLFNINSIFFIYYFLQREYHTSILMWINISLYIVLRLSQGWSGILLTIFFFEMYIYFKKRGIEDRKLSVKNIALICLSVIVVIVVGGFVYRYVYVFKYSVRYGDIFDLTNKLSLSDGISRLTARLSYYSSAVKSSMHFNTITDLYKFQGDLFIELKSMARPLLPRSLMPDKTFYSLGSCVARGITGIANFNISDTNGIFSYTSLIFAISPVLGFIWLILYILAFKFIRMVLNMLTEYEGQFDYLLFVVICAFIETGNIETRFTQTYFKLIFLFPLLIISGTINLQKSRNYYKENLGALK